MQHLHDSPNHTKSVVRARSRPRPSALLRLVLAAAALLSLLVPTRTQAQIGPGKAYRFSAQGASQLTGKEVSLPPPWTVELWVRRSDSPAPSAPLFINAKSALKLEQFHTDRQVGFTLFGSNDYSFAYSAPTSRWVHLAFVATPTSVVLFTNGVANGAVNGSIPLPLDYFGHSPTAASDQLVADVDELRVWKIGLTSEQIRASMGHRLTGGEAGLVLYLQGEESFDNNGDNLVTVPSPVGAIGLAGVPRVLSGALFAPELEATHFIPYQVNTPFLRAGLNPGNLPTTVSFLTGSGYPLSNSPPFAISRATNATVLVNHGTPLPPDGSAVYGQIIASNDAGVAISPVVRAWSPVLFHPGPEILTNECHTPFADPGFRARIGVIGVGAGENNRVMLRGDGLLTRWDDSNTHMGPQTLDPGPFLQVAAGRYATAAIRLDGRVTVWSPDNAPLEQVPPESAPAQAIACGDRFVMSLNAAGRPVVWGFNISGESFVPASATNVIAIAAGAGHCLALTASGRVIGWGDSLYNQSRVPAAAATNAVAIAAGSQHSAVLKADGSVITWGIASGTYYQVPAGVSNIVQISAGYWHTLALRADGQVFCWGLDQRSSNTVPAEAHGARAVIAGYESAFALMPDGSVVSWGHILPYSSAAIESGYEGFLSELTPPDTTLPGSAVALHEATNEFGVFRMEYPVQIVDTHPPSLQLIGDSTIPWYANTPFLDPGVVASDLCDSSFQLSTNGIVDSLRPGAYKIVYTATDASGNQTNLTRVVIVPPSILPPGDLTLDGVVDERDLAFLLDRLHGNGRVGDPELRTVLNRYYATSPWVGMTNVAGLGGSNVVFNLLNGPGSLGFQVDVTTNLVQWKPLGTAVPRYEFNDTNAPTAGGLRVYRLRWP